MANALSIVFAQILTKLPKGLGIRDAIARKKPQEIHKAKTIPNLVLGGFITEVMELLQDQYFKHKYRIKRRTPPFFFVTIFIAKDFFQWLTKALPVNPIPKTINDSDRLVTLSLLVQYRKQATSCIYISIIRKEYFLKSIISLQLFFGGGFSEVPYCNMINNESYQKVYEIYIFCNFFQCSWSKDSTLVSTNVSFNQVCRIDEKVWHYKKIRSFQKTGQNPKIELKEGIEKTYQGF